MINGKKLYSIKGYLIFETEIPIIFLTFILNKMYPVIQPFGAQRCTAMQMEPGDIPQSSIYLVLHSFVFFACLLSPFPTSF